MIVKFIKQNASWQLDKNCFENLLATATTKQQLLSQLQSAAQKYYPQQGQIDTLKVEFCLNRIALSKPKTAEQKTAMSYFDSFWYLYQRLKRVFAPKHRTFYSDGTVTKLETIASLITKCTQFAVDDDFLRDICYQTEQTFDLTEREHCHLWDVVMLYKVAFYCAATQAVFDGKTLGQIALAKMMQPKLSTENTTCNECYQQSAYGNEKLLSVIDNMGNSAVKTSFCPNDIAPLQLKTFIYANGKNVFDTFVCSNFGVNTANFASQTANCTVKMQYFLQDCCEIRNYTITNKSKNKRNFVFDANVSANQSFKYAKIGDALCIATEKYDGYCGCFVTSDKVTVEPGVISAQFCLQPNQCQHLSVVTIYAKSSVQFAQKMACLTLIGSTRQPFLYDKTQSKIKTIPVPVARQSCCNNGRKTQRPGITSTNFCYRFGDENVATFLDNDGNNTTLLNGFAFGIGGEGVYSVTNGLIKQLNDGQFTLDEQGVCYNAKQGVCKIIHGVDKRYQIDYTKATQTLFCFELELDTEIAFDGKVFTLKDAERHYQIACDNVQSFTTNALECNKQRLRYKLSNYPCGKRLLAICINKNTSTTLTISNLNKAPKSTPIIRESLLSIYLTHQNDKNLFCYANAIKAPNPLSLTALNYTNSAFVKFFLETNYKTNLTVSTYDNQGHKSAFCNPLSLPLACVYYLRLVGNDISANVVNVAKDVLQSSFDGKQKCIQALALKKASELPQFDKISCLVAYEKLKQQILQDKDLTLYSQAIGALPLDLPTKDNLRYLCNKYGVDKSWYYVSQLENLYGVNLCDGILQITPSVTVDGCQQFALFVKNKRIDTTFCKNAIPCMTVNGNACVAPFDTNSLTKQQNSLVVSY